MLPKIHLGTLITVTDSHLANHNRERRQAIMEARINRNTEGFYVYQTYLKRLRRMHRAYVTRFKQHQQNKMTTFGTAANQSPHEFDIRGNYIQTRRHQTNVVVNKDSSIVNTGGIPFSQHRVSLAGRVAAPNTPVESLSGSLQSPSLSSGISNEGDTLSTPKRTVSFATDKGMENSSQSLSIHIPCGRETSFELSSNSDQGRENGGALPFRMWKQRHDQSGMPSVYSQDTTSASGLTTQSKSRIILWDKSAPKTVVAKPLFVNQRK